MSIDIHIEATSHSGLDFLRYDKIYIFLSTAGWPNVMQPIQGTDGLSRHQANLNWMSAMDYISLFFKQTPKGEDLLGSVRMAPCSAGIIAPFSGLFLLLKSSQISAIVTHLTPGLLLMYSINLKSIISFSPFAFNAANLFHLSSMNMACGCPLTSG